MTFEELVDAVAEHTCVDRFTVHKVLEELVNLCASAEGKGED